MIKPIFKECIGQCTISKKRKRFVDEIEIIENSNKRQRICSSHTNISSPHAQIITELSDSIDSKAITEFWCQLDSLMNVMSSSLELADSYRLLTDCIETVNDLNKMDPIIQLSNGTYRLHRPPIRKQLAYFVEDKFYFEKI